MGRKILLINLTVLAAIALLAQHLVSSWGTFEAQLVTASNRTSQALELSEVPQAELIQPLPNFMLIPDKNLFTVERTSASQESADEESGRPELAKWPDLLSVTMFGGTRQAELNLYSGGRGQGSGRHTVSVGDVVQGYLVSDIQDNRLILSWEDFSHELTLTPAQKKKKAAAAKQAVNIITIGAPVAAVDATTVVASEEMRGVEISAVGDRRGQVGREGQGQPGGALNQGAGGLGNRSGQSSIAGGRSRRTAGSQGTPRRPLNR